MVNDAFGKCTPGWLALLVSMAMVIYQLSMETQALNTGLSLRLGDNNLEDGGSVFDLCLKPLRSRL